MSSGIEEHGRVVADGVGDFWRIGRASCTIDFDTMVQNVSVI